MRKVHPWLFKVKPLRGFQFEEYKILKGFNFELNEVISPKEITLHAMQDI